MAAAYRLVVSTVNYYNSLVIDQRFQQAIHYCTGTCQTFRHGVDCIVVHHSVCAELLHIPVSSVKNAARAPIFLPDENGLSLAESEENHQILPGIPKVKKLSVVQSTCNLKDIAGEAISFASGKIKEFSLEKLKNSNHVTYRKGRKVKSDSFNRRSVDFDLIFGHYGNDGNYPSFGLLRSSSLEEKPVPHSNSLETNMASMFLQNLSEENLITQILEKHKLDGPSSGTDIKMCLDILLKCSEDLKKCTDIIKQCIKKKSGSNISDGSSHDSFSSSETIYMNVMTRLASYLKKIPFEFMHPGHTENTDLTEFISNLPSLPPTPFSPIFGTEQPPKYEDVVQLAPETGQFHSVEFQEDKHDSIKTGTIKSIQTNSTKGPSNSLQNLELNDPRTMEALQFKPQTLTMNPQESVSSPDFMETLYIEEESDGRKVFEKEKRTENSFNQQSLEMNKAKPEFTNHNSLEKSPTLVQTHTLGKVFEKTAFALSKEDSIPKVTKVEERDQIGIMKPNNQEEIDKLLLDLECFSQRMENTLGQPLAKSYDTKSLTNHTPLVGQIPLDLEPKSKDSSPPEKSPSSCLTRIIETNGHKIEEEDRALLLRILESIEDFAQELVECKSGRGSLSQEKEMMQILQETLTTSSQARSSVCQSHTSEKTKDSTAVVLIQQSPEVIKMMIKETSLRRDPDLRGELAFLAKGCDFVLPSRFKKRLKIFQQTQVQNKQEKKLGTSTVPAESVGSSPRPLSPLLHVNNVAISVPLSINIPQFYFPKGLPDTCANHDQTINRIEKAFMEVEDQKADIYEMGKIAKACGCPFYWKAPMFSAAGGERTGFVSVHSFIAMWRKLLYSCHDDASKFVYLLAKPNYSCLEQDDFIPLLQDVVDTHPGLTFLKDAPEFHSRYITTVIQRIFYTVNRSWTGKITLTELRKSNFLQTLALLEEEEDINQITDYFSYEHFYVIYCKFWELDSDHDLYINQTDLSRYNDQASSNRIIERIFSGAVTRGNVVQKEGRMSYADFVWFLISEEDKRNMTSIEYWFRCMDLDGDGVLSMYELEYFYEEQCERMEAMGIEPLPFHDLLCQMLDLVKPELDGKITLRDLKRCRMAHIFYDTFFNLEKYLDHEQRDPFAVQKNYSEKPLLQRSSISNQRLKTHTRHLDRWRQKIQDVENDSPEPSDWDRYAAEEYEILVAEESANEQLQEGSFEEYEADEPVPSSELVNKEDKIVISSLSEKCGKLHSVDEE